MRQQTRAVSALILGSILLPSVAAHATTYYVATNGSDSANDGKSVDKAWRSVAFAVSKMVAGDTTYVRGGTYNEGVIRFKRSGTQAAPIKLLNYLNEKPKIVFINPDEPDFDRILIQHASGRNVAMGWITIEGLELTNGHDGIKLQNVHDSVIQRNWIHDNKFMGILGIGARVRIDGNKINRNGWFAGCESGVTTSVGTSICNQHHGIYTNGSYFTITNNLIYDNLSYGITQNGSSSSSYNPEKHAGPEFAGAANWVIAHNTFAYNNYRAGIVVWGGSCDGSRIENNIFYENGVELATSGIQGIACSSCGGSENVRIRNNHAYASGTGAQAFISSSGFHASTVNSGNVINVSNPGFVNALASLPSSPNFALTAQSPVIDKGLVLAAVTTDFLGVTRPQGGGYDIGAYEFSGNASPPTACSQSPGSANYCKECGPCDKGVGNCTQDADCASGLQCAADIGSVYGFGATVDVCEPPAPSLANTYTMSASSADLTNPVTNLWDGCTDGKAACTTGSRSLSSFWVEFDLGQVHRLSSARLFGDANDNWQSSSWSLRYKLLPGDDWTTAADSQNALLNDWSTVSLDTFAQFVRVEVHGSAAGTGTEARELEIYGVPEEPSTPTPEPTTNPRANPLLLC